MGRQSLIKHRAPRNSHTNPHVMLHVFVMLCRTNHNVMLHVPMLLYINRQLINRELDAVGPQISISAVLKIVFSPRRECSFQKMVLLPRRECILYKTYSKNELSPARKHMFCKQQVLSCIRNHIFLYGRVPKLC